MQKRNIMKRITALALGLALLCPGLPAARAQAAESQGETKTETVYIPQDNFGQIAEGSGGLKAGVLRSGVGFDRGVSSFEDNAASYWSGESLGESPVGSGRTFLFRMEIPEDIRPQWIDSIKLEMTVQECHNGSDRILSLFALNEELPETVSTIWAEGDASVKSAYSCKELAAVSNQVSGYALAGTKVIFDLTDYAKNNGDKQVYEFEVLSSADMVSFYDAASETEGNRPKFTVTYSEKSPLYWLSQAVDAAKELEADAYTGGSYQALQTAIEAAEAVIAKGEGAEQTEIDDALSALSAQVDAMVEIRSLKELIEAVEETENLDGSGEVLAQAKEVAAKADATQQEVDDIYAALNAVLSRGLKNPLHIATYYGKAPTGLPTRVNGQKVTWDECSGEEFNLLYSTVTVKGTLESGESVSALVDIVPENLRYFIDTGTGADWKSAMLTSANTADSGQAYALESAAYSAVSVLTGQGLLNQESDQQYGDGKSWGFVYEVTNGRPHALQTYPNGNNGSGYSDGVLIEDKYDMGLRASTDQNFAYVLTLPAGTYTLTTGFREFYGSGRTREMIPVLTDADSGDGIATFDKISMVNATGGMTASGTFTISKETAVKIHYSKAGGENGSMNWLAVAEGEEPAPILNLAALRKAVENADKIYENVKNGTEYAAKSMDFLNRMYEQATQMLADSFDNPDGGFAPYAKNPKIVQTMVDVIRGNLEIAVRDMVVRQYDPHRYDSVPVGNTWLDTEGAVIQAHGGGFLQMEDTDGTPIYYWVGEDKSHNRAAFNGVSLYASKDLLNWDFKTTLLSTDYMDIALLPNKVMERPKLLYNEKTGKYVLWVHWEGKDYSASQILVATSDTVDGDYQVIGHWRPGAQEGYKNWGVYQDGTHFDEPNEDGSLRMVENVSDSSLWGYASRDMTVFSDGENAYLASLGRIYKLNDEYTDVDTEAMASYSMPNGHNGWEAPALVKMGEYYVIVGSAQTGWSPNQCRYYFTKNIEDPNGWQTNPDQSNGMFYIGNNTTYHSQSTNIMVLNGTEGSSFVYMGDHWVSNALAKSTYVWLPIEITEAEDGSPRLTMRNYSRWNLDVGTGSVVVPEYEKEPISRGKKITCDVAANESYPLANAMDGDYYTNFIPNPARAPFSFTIDLEEVYNLTRFDLSTRMLNGSETYYQFSVETSMDGVTWEKQIDQEKNTDQGFRSDMLTGQGRYVRVNIIGEYRKDGLANQFLGVSEIEVFGYPVDEEAENAVRMGDVQNVKNEAGEEVVIPVYAKGIGTDRYRAVNGMLQIPAGFAFVGMEATDNLTGGSLNSTAQVGEDGILRFAYLKTDAVSGDATTISQNNETDAVFNLKLSLKEALEPGSTHQVVMQSFTATSSTEDGDTNSYATVEFDITKAAATIIISTAVQPEEITAEAVELYVGNGLDLIPEDKKAVSVVFTNAPENADILFGDAQLYYSPERSEKTGQVVYVGLVGADVDISSMNVDSTAAAEAVYTINGTGRQEVLFGETNEDGIVNAADALNVLNGWLRNREVSADKDILRMNVTADGQIDTSDVLGIVDNFVNGRGFAVVNR